MPAELSDKVILITGASSGIGAATAVACAEAGMHVTLAARREDKLKQVAQRCVAAGPPGIKAQWVVCDVDDDKAVRRAFAESWTYFGRLDAVFANAGVGLTKPVLATALAEHQSLLNTNYLSTVRTLLVANEYFKRTPSGLGHFVICSSCLSDLGLPNNAVYSATKAAQKALADGLRAEVARRGLHVTSVHPIGTRTEFFDTSAKRSGRDNPELHVPDHRLQDPMKIGRRGRGVAPPPPGGLGLGGRAHRDGAAQCRAHAQSLGDEPPLPQDRRPTQHAADPRHRADRRLDLRPGVTRRPRHATAPAPSRGRAKAMQHVPVNGLNPDVSSQRCRWPQPNEGRIEGVGCHGL